MERGVCCWVHEPWSWWSSPHPSREGRGSFQDAFVGLGVLRWRGVMGWEKTNQHQPDCGIQTPIPRPKIAVDLNARYHDKTDKMHTILRMF